MITVPILLIR